MKVGLNAQGWDEGRFYYFQILLLLMDSSDEDFLPDPERFRVVGQGSSLKRKKKPPDREDFNKQSGLNLHDDFNKGKCFFISFV